MTGIELIKTTATTPGEIADIISEHCPPTIHDSCDRVSCRECWLAWMTGAECEEKPEASAEPTPQADKTQSDELDNAEKSLQDLFRRTRSTDAPDEEQARLVSSLSTFGRLLEKEQRAPNAADVHTLTQIATGLYDGSVIVRAEPKADGRSCVCIIDAVRRVIIGHAVIKRMGSTYYIESVELTSPQP